MKRFIITALVLAAISTGAWRFRQQELETLRAKAARAREQRAQPDLSRKEIAAELAEAIDTNKVARLRALQPELARLRGSIGALRARTNRTPEQIHAQAEKIRAEAMLIRARFEASEKSKAARDSIGTCLMLATMAQHYHLTLVEGRVSCITCHDPLNSGWNHQTLTRSGVDLCSACHNV